MTVTTTDEAIETDLTYIYLIGADGSSVVKIGKADDVPQRLASLQTGSPLELVIHETFRCEWAVETSLHRRYGHLRIRGEWFDFGDLDPVAEVAGAVAEIEAERKAQRERQLERRRWFEERPMRWAPAIIGDRTLVYPTPMGGFPEGARCVAKTKKGLRCGASLEDSQITNPNYQWRVPGHGLINCDFYGDSDETEAARWLAQRCRRHAGANSPAFCEPEWEVFDPEKHSEALRPDLPVAPGLTDPLDAVDDA